VRVIHSRILGQRVRTIANIKHESHGNVASIVCICSVNGNTL